MTVSDTIWIDRANKQVASALNSDWKKSTFTISDLPEMTFAVNAMNLDGKVVSIGEATAKFFKWDNPPSKTFVGFVVTVFSDNIVDSAPVNFYGEDENFNLFACESACRTTKFTIANRRCRKCGTFDKKKYEKKSVKCTNCGLKDRTDY